MVLDTSVKGQTYVEDYEVCCHPVEVRYTVNEVRNFARALWFRPLQRGDDE